MLPVQLSQRRLHVAIDLLLARDLSTWLDERNILLGFGDESGHG